MNGHVFLAWTTLRWFGYLLGNTIPPGEQILVSIETLQIGIAEQVEIGLLSSFKSLVLTR
jgi:hypothetical protein